MPLVGSAVGLERDLQTYIERNMLALLGVRFVASEHYTGAQHAGRVDSLGLDEDGSPVVIEYKRRTDENVISQSLYYMSWLRDHRSEFESLVAARISPEAAAEVDWSSPRIICIAADFSRYDAHAVREIGRRIDLVRYTRFGEDLLALELFVSVAGSGARTRADATAVGAAEPRSRTVGNALAQAPEDLVALYRDLDARLLELGDTSSVTLAQYVAYRRSRNFACVKVLTGEETLVVYLRVDPSTVELQEGFTRDVSRIGHHGTGDLEVRIRSVEDLDRAADLLAASYRAA
ncbi:putative transport protein [Streptacidiphilus sp. BW17]|uniref:endonuclease NucS domain-containing protein n=1 Tax=Streptacidiphilus sp. BW17 TaxID=3156274 RepID=UPI003519A97F